MDETRHSTENIRSPQDKLTTTLLCLIRLSQLDSSSIVQRISTIRPIAALGHWFTALGPPWLPFESSVGNLQRLQTQRPSCCSVPDKRLLAELESLNAQAVRMDRTSMCV
ncbi:predicted protein [Histoplasma capsulatum H143]|uniref:Uncharacterized protein n=1 Tax=Ajellomyces capsulatus (strain H143) TaxID=544712 RepID=C6HMT8_AJECH|nr:predicted protein [Histoplasma capsulatum H143]